MLPIVLRDVQAKASEERVYVCRRARIFLARARNPVNGLAVTPGLAQPVNYIQVRTFGALALRKFLRVFDVALDRFTRPAHAQKGCRQSVETFAPFFRERVVAREPLEEGERFSIKTRHEIGATQAEQSSRDIHVVRVRLNDCLKMFARFCECSVGEIYVSTSQIF